MQRSIERILKSKIASDGAGVKINRNIVGEDLTFFDPFLMLDEIYSDDPDDYIGGFPEHPHRGFETVTYMLDGKMRHSDHLGNEGTLGPGGIQWMTAGRGVLHSEMPVQESGRLHGFQLWINLPASEKMREPNYQDIPQDLIPVIKNGENFSVKILAGDFLSEGQNVRGPVSGINVEPDIFDVHIKAHTLEIPTKVEKKVLIYVYEGCVGVAGQNIKSQEMGMLSSGDSVVFTSEVGSKFLFLSAMPLGEPIASWGPFVMNTFDEVREAIEDFKGGRLIG